MIHIFIFTFLSQTFIGAKFSPRKLIHLPEKTHKTKNWLFHCFHRKATGATGKPPEAGGHACTYLSLLFWIKIKNVSFSWLKTCSFDAVNAAEKYWSCKIFHALRRGGAVVKKFFLTLSLSLSVSVSESWFNSVDVQRHIQKLGNTSMMELFPKAFNSFILFHG